MEVNQRIQLVVYGPAPKVVTPRQVEQPTRMNHLPRSTPKLIPTNSSQLSQFMQENTLINNNNSSHVSSSNQIVEASFGVSGFQLEECVPEMFDLSVLHDNIVSNTSPFAGQNPSNGEESLICTEDWEEFFDDDEREMTPTGKEMEILLAGSPDSCVSGRSSLYDDVENSFTPEVERNLYMHLSSTPAKDLKLPDVPISCHDELLQFEMEIDRCPSIRSFEGSLSTSTSEKEFAELEVFQPEFYEVTSNVVESSEDIDQWINYNQEIFSPPLFDLDLGNNDDSESGNFNENTAYQSEVVSFGGLDGEHAEENQIVEFALDINQNELTENDAKSASGYNLPSEEEIHDATNETTSCADDDSVSEAVTSPECVLKQHKKAEKEEVCFEMLPRYLQAVRDPKKKKSQNREAAQRYRCKKKNEGTTVEEKLNILRTRKLDVKERIENKRREVAVLEELLGEIKQNTSTS